MAGSIPSNFPSLTDVTTEEWQRLADRRVFFGHQSVGDNLIQGVQELLKANPSIPLRVVEAEDASQIRGPALYHARIGKNGAPNTKLDAFSDIVSKGMTGPGVAMLKYCYVDITAETDPQQLFNAYRAQVERLRAANPQLTIVHVTLPLTSDRGTLYHWRTVVRGKTSHRELNLIRQRYNEFMRQAYGGREPLFDLARYESSRAMGEMATVGFRGTTVPVLASEWTYDGGHLNEAGRQRMASAFLATLAKM